MFYWSLFIECDDGKERVCTIIVRLFQLNVMSSMLIKHILCVLCRFYNEWIKKPFQQIRKGLNQSNEIQYYCLAYFIFRIRTLVVNGKNASESSSLVPLRRGLFIGIFVSGSEIYFCLFWTPFGIWVFFFFSLSRQFGYTKSGRHLETMMQWFRNHCWWNFITKSWNYYFSVFLVCHYHSHSVKIKSFNFIS